MRYCRLQKASGFGRNSKCDTTSRCARILMRENIQIGVKCVASTVLSQFSKIWQRRRNRCGEQDRVIQTNRQPQSESDTHRDKSEMYFKMHLDKLFADVDLHLDY